MAAADPWTNETVWEPHQQHVRLHPVETMLRVVFSPAYCELFRPTTPDMKVLDVGCYHTNNLVPFFDRGCACYGVEINPSLVSLALEGQRRHGISVTVAEGNNRHIPFANDTFDILLSINTIHYEVDLPSWRAGVREFYRATKPGGRVFIMTHGPQHFFQSTAERLSDSRIKIGVESDARFGTFQTAFDSHADLAHELQKIFLKVETGESFDFFPKQNLHFLWGLCVK